MDSLFQLMNYNWLGVVIGLVGLVLAVLSLITAYVFYRRAKPQRALAYQFLSYKFPGTSRSPSSEIEITFRGKTVPHITKSLVSVWNSGNTTLEGEQIVVMDQLRIVTSPESEILDVSVLRVTRELNKFSAEKSDGKPNEIICGFEWLDPGDGALIQALHTGKTLLSVAGTVRGMPAGPLNLGTLTMYTSRSTNRFESLMDLIGKISIAPMIGYILFLGGNVFLVGIRAYSTNRAKALLGIILGPLFCLGISLLLGSTIARGLWRKPPQSLRLKEGD